VTGWGKHKTPGRAPVSASKPQEHKRAVRGGELGPPNQQPPSNTSPLGACELTQTSDCSVAICLRFPASAAVRRKCGGESSTEHSSARGYVLLLIAINGIRIHVGACLSSRPPRPAHEVDDLAPRAPIPIPLPRPRQPPLLPGD